MNKVTLHDDYHRITPVKAGSDRSFGFVMGGFFFLIFGISFFKTGQFRIWVLLISILFLGVAFFKSEWLNPLNKLWLKFGGLLNSITSPIILLILFIFAFIPVGLLLKLFKKDILSLKRNHFVKTYWIDSSTNATSTMKDQF